MFASRAMGISISRYGLSVSYKCYQIKSRWGAKCPDRNTDKCLKCKYCKAEMSGHDATTLFNAYGKYLNSTKFKK